MRRSLAFLFMLLVASSIGTQTKSHAADSEPDELTFCHFGPKLKLLDIQADEKGGCQASAKVQGVMWECGVSTVADSKTAEFKRRLSELAEEKCKSFCKDRGSQCEFKFVFQPKCGLDVPSSDVMNAGKVLGCRKDCTGQAFMYCSLVDAGFRTEDPERTATQPANCHCSTKR